MLTITVNGQQKKLSIGCRTFISLDVLLRMLEADVQSVTLNGEIISRQDFGNTTIKGGDSLQLK
jgi:sulfur carrier protein ThiS